MLAGLQLVVELVRLQLVVELVKGQFSAGEALLQLTDEEGVVREEGIDAGYRARENPSKTPWICHTNKVHPEDFLKVISTIFNFFLIFNNLDFQLSNFTPLTQISNVQS